jgi:nucleoside 2-deoxyribosyltransferase
MKIYLAGPSVFYADWEAQATAMKAACALRGAIGIYPFDNELPAAADPFERGLAIFARDRDMVHECDGIVADFSPFRGASADVGTVWEFAFAQGIGKAVAAFSRDRRDYAERLPKFWTASENEDVEAFGMAEGLMLVGPNLNGRPERRERTVGGLFGAFDEALDACLDELRNR